MDFEPTEEQRMLKKTVREFSQKVLFPRAREIEKGEKIPDDIIKQMADMGILGIGLSPEYGGSGMDPVTVGLVAEELARGDITCAVPVFFLVQTAWGCVLQKYGSDELKGRVLPGVAAGKQFLGIASTEPDTGSDVTAIRTRGAMLGGRWHLDGEKMFISGVRESVHQMPGGGGHLTLARTGAGKGGAGISMFYVPLTSRGIDPTYLEDWGRRGISTGGFAMVDVELPASHLIGEEGKGFYAAMEGFDYARGIIGMICCGVAQRCMELGIDHIKGRKAFGQHLGKFEGVQFKLAENWAQVEAVRLLALRGLWALKTEREGRGSRFASTMAIAMAKMLAPVQAFGAINDAMQWFGAMGYTEDCPLELGLKGVRSYMWAEGATEIQKLIVARELLGRDFFRND
ncbi:MAG: acyl-CoA/acyl-ACP dehydrogenase [Euryarchaeota archaeon]|nr:acyl-CoA/acyl-ACP dehydrogenase [Euryarchaeota archaeon]